jgi:hypothetical protein
MSVWHWRCLRCVRSVAAVTHSRMLWRLGALFPVRLPLRLHQFSGIGDDRVGALAVAFVLARSPLYKRYPAKLGDSAAAWLRSMRAIGVGGATIRLCLL